MARRSLRAHRGLLERPVTRRRPDDASATRLWGRPELYTAYEQDMALLNTPGKKIAVGLAVLVAVAGTALLPADWLTLVATAYAVAIGAIGLNIVTGYAGQVSLGHAFFVGIGAFTGAVVSGATGARVWGWGITFLPVPLLAAGLVAALFGLVVAPLALRLKGLYLAIVTLGLVFLGLHIFREAAFLTGGVGVGRPGLSLTLFGLDVNATGEILGMMATADQRRYLLALLLLIVFAVVARNIARSDLGRAFAAVRDRDIAAEIIGVNLTKAKVLAFVISSFYAGVAGALVYTITRAIEPGSFGLILSIRYIAMILIGGVATVSGSILGAGFLTMLGRFSQELVALLPAAIQIPEELFEGVLAGVLLVAFLIFEPRGLYGIWVRTRNYWKGWPFSY